jgi:hypothetical protein
MGLVVDLVVVVVVLDMLEVTEQQIKDMEVAMVLQMVLNGVLVVEEEAVLPLLEEMLMLD